MTDLRWYLRRLSRMGAREVASRTVAVARIRRWRTAPPAPTGSRADRQFSAVLGDMPALEEAAAKRLISTAEAVLEGRREYFGVLRRDLVDPDWFLDPRTGRRCRQDVYAFDVSYRDEATVGDIKQIWELSRHQHLTVLAAAYAISGEDRYAQRVGDHLKSWWAANPPLRGVHWVSGIELGVRLISWVWIRRLLHGWPGSAALFEDNPVALEQIWYHQRWLASLGSKGSSANNHVIAEAAGQLVAACAFGWFTESPRWRRAALQTLDEQLQHNTFGSGLNRELATDYHRLVLELGLAAAVEAEAAGVIVPESVWQVLLRMTDALAAVVDCRLRPPRQGDSDDGHGLVLDGDGSDPWAGLLATGDALFGRLPWWPRVDGTGLRTRLFTALAPDVDHAALAARPPTRPAHFADAGMTIMRSATEEEIWCRCDGGPHGFLSIAAHAHADALSIEVRHDGVDILADPGTYCYHGDPEWRHYFRSTLGHNTLELDERNQSRSGGPFLWTRHARSRVLAAHVTTAGRGRWCAEHDGCSHRGWPAVHRRTVELDGSELRVLDEALSPEPVRSRLAFHMGPTIEVQLVGNVATLCWARDGHARRATMLLPEQLSWVAHRGETSPPLGWYSEGFGRKEPSVMLVGAGSIDRSTRLRTVLRFDAGSRTAQATASS